MYMWESGGGRWEWNRQHDRNSHKKYNTLLYNLYFGHYNVVYKREWKYIYDITHMYNGTRICSN